MSALQRYLSLTPQITTNDDKATKRAKAAADDDVVFLSIDLEAYEFAQDKITEIGVATLDTRELAGVEPGAKAGSWLSKIRTRHLRIREYKKLVNKRWIKGCPDKFNFGVSEFIQLNQARKILTGIFNDPAAQDPSPVQKRNIVLVGHGLKNDTDYLKSLQFSPNAGGNVVRSLDTQVLAGSNKKMTVGLERLLRALDIEPLNLHNAGNDAAYTLQALVMMAVQQTASPGVYLAAVQATPVPEKFKNRHRKANKTEVRIRYQSTAGPSVKPTTSSIVAEQSTLPTSAHNQFKGKPFV